MNVYELELRSKWNCINCQQCGSLELGISHPLEWHAGYSSPEEKFIAIVTDEPVSKIESSKNIQAICMQRKDGRYATSFKLISKELEDVFVTMCGDMMRFSSTESDKSLSLTRVLKRYSAWLKLLQHKNNALLSMTAQKGLIGELLYLKDLIERGMPPTEAVTGWVGPDGADQDFVYADGWHEIKTTTTASTEVIISSAEQLGGEETGELVVIRIDKCAPAQTGAFTLYKLVHEILRILNIYAGLADSFMLKLNCAGYIDMPDYDQQTFVFSSKNKYSVDDKFPKLIRSNIPTEITNLNYALSLPSLAPWAK